MREEIIKLLIQCRLKEALTQMAGYAASTSDWQLKNEIEALQTSYGLMLQYHSKGMKDPNKEEIYHKMIRTAYDLNDRVQIAVQATKGHSVYYDTMRRFAQVPPHSYSELQMQLEAYTEDMATAPLIYVGESKRKEEMDAIRKRHETAVDELFEKTWVSVRWSESESAEAQTLFQSLLIQANDLAVMISAVTMSLLQIFDIRKFMFLLDAYTHPDNLLNQRAMVGILLAIYYHEDPIQRFPEAVSRLDELNDDPGFIKDLYNIQIQLLLSSRETRKIDKKMREEIIPEMMKNPKLGTEAPDEDAEDRNPEWEEWIDRSGITDKLRELGELQMAGADVYMSTFSQLKHYPFFHKISHWFYPFDPQYRQIAELPLENSEQKSSLLQLLINSGNFCDSDKYSFCLAMMQMPESQRKIMLQQLGSQQEITEELKESLDRLVQIKDAPKTISRQYIHNLYRFFKLWQRRNEMHDIFEDKLDLWNCLFLDKAIQDKEFLYPMAEYLFTQGYLQDAADLYDLSFTVYGAENAEMLQKTGFIYQKRGLYKEAISYYLQADLLMPDNVWNNRHLAQCYRKERDYQKAWEYYHKVEQVQPDSLPLALQIGQCLVELERYDEALAYFFKVEYLDKKPQNARRAIGWCSFITGNHSQAKKYYDLLIAEPKPTVEDWMNAGHVYYALGETEQAIEHYRKAQNLCDSHETFYRLFQSDFKYLREQGFDRTDLNILPDELI